MKPKVHSSCVIGAFAFSVWQDNAIEICVEECGKYPPLLPRDWWFSWFLEGYDAKTTGALLASLITE